MTPLGQWFKEKDMHSVFRGSDNFDTAGGNAVKAWVNFNGTGTVAIRASFNVSSITDNGTGDYTVNFTTALADANYAPNIQTNSNVTSFVAMFGGYQFTTDTKTASAYRFHTGFSDAAAAGVGDWSDINVAILR